MSELLNSVNTVVTVVFVSGSALYRSLSSGAKECYSLNHVQTRKCIYPSNVCSVIPRVRYNKKLFTPSFLDLVSRYF